MATGTDQTPAIPAVGIEIAASGTRISALARPSQGVVRLQTRLAAPPSPADAVAAVSALVARATGRVAGQPIAIGVALWDARAIDGGVVDGLRNAPGWDAFALATRLSAQWGGIAAMVMPAPDAAAVAEARQGAGRDAHRVLYVLLGRSAWSVLTRDGQVIVGSGALAHWRVAADGPRCSCGMRGHLEPLASAQALVRNLIGRAAASDASMAALLRVSGGRAEALSAAGVVRLVAAGDTAAVAVASEALDALAPALANLAATLQPDRIVLGGPLALAGAAWCGPLGARVRALCQAYMVPPPVVAGVLEPDAVLVGAQLAAGEAKPPDWQAHSGDSASQD